MCKLIEGGCLCGAVRYETTAKPVSAIHCYCRQCQHITGAGHASQFALPSASVTLRGEVSESACRPAFRQAPAAPAA